MALLSLLQKRINNLGKELKEILEKTPTLNDPTLATLFVTESNKKLDPHIHRRLDELVNMSPEAIKQSFEDYDDEHLSNLEKLADVFGDISKQYNFPEAALYAAQAAAIYDYITTTTATFSYERMAKLAALKNA